MSGAAHAALDEFLATFVSSFQPPAPCRGKSGRHWLVSGVWSEYLKQWLRQHYVRVQFYPEHPLDAALWRSGGADAPDIGLEWEWDHNKVHKEFADGDFVKTLTIAARSALAIVHTRADGRRGESQANDTIQQIRRAYADRCRDGRPAAVVEIRRARCSPQRVEFNATLHDLVADVSREAGSFEFDAFGR